MTDDGVLEGGRSVRSDGTSESLLVRIKARDETAWEHFTKLYEPLVRSWCLGFGLPESDTPDAVQEVFETVARSIKGYHHDRAGDTFRGWLKTITRSRVIDAMRRRRGRPNGVGGSDALADLHALPAPPEDPGSSDADDRGLLVRRAVELVLGKSEEKTRQAFLRVVLGGEHPSDVSKDLGMTPNAVYLATSRVKRKIRQEFAETIDI